MLLRVLRGETHFILGPFSLFHSPFRDAVFCYEFSAFFSLFFPLDISVSSYTFTAVSPHSVQKLEIWKFFTVRAGLSDPVY